MSSDILDDLKKAAERRQALADAHREKARNYSREARDFERVACEIERKIREKRGD